MNLALWIAAGFVAVLALSSGISKTFVPKDKLAAFHQRALGYGWTADASVGLLKTVGVLELLAGVGLILPAAVDIAPVLVPVTAICWVLLMVGAAITHVRRGESLFVLMNVVYLAVAAFVAWGRFVLEPFTG